MATLIKTLLLVLEELFYFVFPLSDDELTIKKLTGESVRRKLQASRSGETIVLAQFADAEVRALLHLVKFHHHPRALKLTASLFESWLEMHVHAPSVIVPIPLSKERLRKRGYNQSELIARAAITNLPSHRVDTSILQRTRDTQPQTKLKRTERLKNMTGAFSAATGTQSLAGLHIILLDDVMTTGATLRAAKIVLQPLTPRSITCIAIAH